MEATGTIHRLFEPETVGSFTKRKLVLEIYNGKYPQYPDFEFTQGNATKLDGFVPGDRVTVSFDLNGREWTSPQGETKYFTTLRGYKIERA
jgi:hypothetical protein